MQRMSCWLAPLVLSIATATPAQETPPEKATNTSECALPEGWLEVAELDPRFVVFGELHGTQQGPEFVGSLACALALRGERVLLAIEQSAHDNDALQSAWNMSGAQFESAAARSGWAGRRDGVASEAMFAMLVRLHGLKEGGLPVSVARFNGTRDAEQLRRFADLPGQGPHEAAQAENIAEAAASGRYDRVLVLVGSFHARKDQVMLVGATIDPMARRLARYGKTVTLEMRHGAGTAWNCALKAGVRLAPGEPIGSDAIECANHATGGNGAFDRRPFIDVAPTAGPTGEFDGFFWVGPLTGSPPLLPTE